MKKQTTTDQPKNIVNYAIAIMHLKTGEDLIIDSYKIKKNINEYELYNGDKNPFLTGVYKPSWKLIKTTNKKNEVYYWINDILCENKG